MEIEVKTFLAVYLGNAESARMKAWNALDKAEQDARSRDAMQAWQAWAERNAEAIVETGAPLGKTKRADGSGLQDVVNELAAYTVVRADSHEAAARLFVDHPHFSIFPGSGVEIMEILPMPQMTVA